MFFPWYSTMMLVAESNNVIGLRLAKMALGGPNAFDEACLMISEKIAASWEASTMMMGGGSTFAVVDRYRQHVASNAGRLAIR